MYILRGHIGRRGFSLEKDGNRVFESNHSFGFMRSSKITIGGDVIAIKSQNLIGSKFQIFKNGEKIGNLDFSSYLFSKLSLQKSDGSVDVFKLEEDGFSQVYILSQGGSIILKFARSLNPFRSLNPLLFSEKITIEVLARHFSPSAIEELIAYVGEILFRNPSSNTGSSM